MKSDDQFEKRLEKQVMRPLPAEWRQEILGVARKAGSIRSDALLGVAEFAMKVRLLMSAAARMFSNLVWPNPKSWAGLAAVWALILGLNLFNGEQEQPAVAQQQGPPWLMMQELLQERQQMLAEIVDDRPETALPKTPGQPRSERRAEFVEG